VSANTKDYCNRPRLEYQAKITGLILEISDMPVIISKQLGLSLKFIVFHLKPLEFEVVRRRPFLVMLPY
jgi:hypothetical protein